MSKSKKSQSKKKRGAALASKMAATEELARARPFNDIKAAEFDPKQGSWARRGRA